MSGVFTTACRALAGGFFAVAMFIFARAIVASGTYPGKDAVLRYEAHLDRTLRLLFIKAKARTIVRGQVVGCAVGVLAFVVTGEAVALLVIVAALGLPMLHLTGERIKRRALFDAQADAFILALANSLKAVPSIGAALQGVLPVLQDPIKQEIGVVLSELRVGSSVDQAILNAAARAESPSFDAAVSALLVGRQVGGNLPKILETTAASVREMNRLAGVVRSKTSESRAQLWVLALFPVGIVIAFRWIKPDYFDPLQHTDVGRLITGVAVLLWLGALTLARKFSQVDL